MIKLNTGPARRAPVLHRLKARTHRTMHTRDCDADYFHTQPCSWSRELGLPTRTQKESGRAHSSLPLSLSYSHTHTHTLSVWSSSLTLARCNIVKEIVLTACRLTDWRTCVRTAHCSIPSPVVCAVRRIVFIQAWRLVVLNDECRLYCSIAHSTVLAATNPPARWCPACIGIQMSRSYGQECLWSRLYRSPCVVVVKGHVGCRVCCYDSDRPAVGWLYTADCENSYANW